MSDDHLNIGHVYRCSTITTLTGYVRGLLRETWRPGPKMRLVVVYLGTETDDDEIDPEKRLNQLGWRKMTKKELAAR